MNLLPVRTALLELFAMYAAHKGATHDVKDFAGKLPKRKDLKVALAPIAKLFKWPEPARIVQACVELPADAPAHQVMADLVAEGLVPRPWVPVARGALPSRSVWRPLLVSGRLPVVYANEDRLVSVWSTETGAHLADLRIPCKKVDHTDLVELPDGTLRAVTWSRHMGGEAQAFERSPDGDFRRVLNLGPLSTRVVGPNHDWIVGSIDSASVETPEGPQQRIAIHDISARVSREVRVRAGQVSGAMARCTDGAGAVQVVFVTSEVRPREPDTPMAWDERVVVLDPVTGAFHATLLAPAGRFHDGAFSGAPGHAIVRLAPEDGAYGYLDVDLATGSVSPGVEPPGVEPRGVRLDYVRGNIGDDKTVMAWHGLAGEPYRGVAARVPGQEKFVVAGADPAVPVTVIVPWTPAWSDVPATGRAEKLDWARPGTVLNYQIADFDVDDRWSFEVLSVSDGLALRVRTGEADDIVAERLVLSPGALAKGESIIELAQGSANVDLGLPQSEALAPLMVSRAVFASLSKGKATAFQGGWSDSVKLTGTRSECMVQVGEGEATRDVRVGIYRAGDPEGAVSLVVLDDADWPLVIDRTEGDCSVRLVGIIRPQTAPAAGA